MNDSALPSAMQVRVMPSINRIGAAWAGASHALLTDLLREEWGFQGMVITDMFVSMVVYANCFPQAEAKGKHSVIFSVPGCGKTTQAPSSCKIRFYWEQKNG